MQTSSLGKFEGISRLTLGGGGIGQVWGETSQDEAIATVRLAYESGINFFDLAPLYGKGEAERVMGLAFADGYPSDLRITTKCMVGQVAPESVEEKLRTSLEQSLERLRRTAVDVYILHGYVIPDGFKQATRPDVLPAVAVAWSTYENFVIPAFERLCEEGTIGAWGITAASVQEANLKTLSVQTKPGLVQCIANLLDSPGNMALTEELPNPREVITKASENKVGVMGIRAVAAGSLTDKVDREVSPRSRIQRDYDRALPFRAIAKDLGVAPSVLAHQYALTIPGVDTLVLGVKNREELEQCLLAESLGPMEAELMARIDEAVS